MKPIYPAKRYQDMKVLINIYFKGRDEGRESREGEGGVVRIGMMVVGTDICCTISMFPSPVCQSLFYHVIVLFSSHSMWHITGCEDMTTILLSFPSY